MINSRELRIGNWIKFGELQHKCTHFDISNLAQMEMRNQPSEEYQPIKLTSKFLKAFGFKKPSTWWTLDCGDKGGVFEIYKRETSFKSAHSFIEIQYVHQLQNLFFARTGQELEWEFLTAKCKKCGDSTSETKHTCPYKSDMHDDKKTLCNCCDACETECAKEV